MLERFYQTFGITINESDKYFMKDDKKYFYITGESWDVYLKNRLRDIEFLQQCQSYEEYCLCYDLEMDESSYDDYEEMLFKTHQLIEVFGLDTIHRILTEWE